jgi:hypothetical protein
MRRALIFLLFILGALVAPAASSAQAPVPDARRIRAAVFVAGLDLGGRTVAEAWAALAGSFGAQYREPVVIRVAGKQFKLTRRAVRFRFRPYQTARQALAAGLASPPAADGSVVPVTVTPVVSYRGKAIRAWIKRIRAAVAVAPRNAAIAYSIRRIVKKHSKPGRRLRARGLRGAIEAGLTDPFAPRLLRPGRRVVPARIGWEDLPKAYSTVITIEQSTFKLRLFKRLKLFKAYRVAVGQPAFPTPSGTFSITSKQVNPTWTAPNSPWAGELAGQQVPGGAANNPLRARWMGLAGGVGIHGTGQPWSIGTRASHGCIRMTVPDVVDLFRRVPLATPVFIK